jgi:hypothetical protein
MPLRRVSCFCFALLLMALVVPCGAQNLPNLQAIKIVATVTASSTPGVFNYSYETANPAASTASVWKINVDISKPPGTIDLSSAGLVDGPGFLQEISDTVASDPTAVVVVPVALQAPVHWRVAISIDGTVAWFSATANFFIQPGGSSAGYVISSQGLPAIRSFIARPFVDVDTLSVTPPTGQGDVQRYLNEVTAIEDSVSAKGVTVAPTAPPATFQPVQFLQTIEGYKEQALKQGWINNAGVANSLDVKLNAALAALQMEDSATAKNVLNALLNEVEAQSNKHLSPEAVALLQFNTRYLISKLP